MISYLVITPFGGRGLDHLANKDVDDVFKVARSETLDGTKIKQNEMEACQEIFFSKSLHNLTSFFNTFFSSVHSFIHLCSFASVINSSDSHTVAYTCEILKNGSEYIKRHSCYI